MNRLFTVIFFIAALFAGSTAMATEGIAYECTAEDGSVSFLDKSPTEGCVKVRQIKIGKTIRGADGEETSLEDLAKQQEQQHQQAIAEREEHNRKVCAKREDVLKILKSKSDVVVTDPNTGKKKALSAAEHEAEIQKHQEYVDTFCKGDPNNN